MDISDFSRRLLFDLFDYWNASRYETHYLQQRLLERYLHPEKCDRAERPIIISLKAEWGAKSEVWLSACIEKIVPEYRLNVRYRNEQRKHHEERYEKERQKEAELKRLHEVEQVQRSKEFRQSQAEQQRIVEEAERQRAEYVRHYQEEQKRLKEEKEREKEAELKRLHEVEQERFYEEFRQGQAEQQRSDAEAKKQRAKLARQRQTEQKRLDKEAIKRRVILARQSEAEWKHYKQQAETEKQKVAAQKQNNEQVTFAKKQKIEALHITLNKLFEEDFLAVDDYYARKCADAITEDEYKTLKRAFVRSWIATYQESLRIENPLRPDDQQLDAIASVNGDYQVIARAGSGKTMTVVLRTVFLVEHCHVAPHAIMLLALNKQAAHEIRIRLFRLLYPNKQRAFEEKRKKWRITGQFKSKEEKLRLIEMEVLTDFISKGLIVLPYVLTFHSLAYRIMQPDNILVDGDDEYGERSETVSRIVSNILHDLGKGEMIRKVMLARYRADYDRLVNDKNYLEKDEYLQFRRSLRYVTLQNDFVKSLGEKRIANFLFEHNIPYKYEKSFVIKDVKFRPDFTISLKHTHKTVDDVIIEFYGLQGRADYDEQTTKKNRMWTNRPRTIFIPLYPSDLRRADFERYFAGILSQHGIVCEKLSDDVIWAKIKDLGAKEFAKSTQRFLDQISQANVDVAWLRAAIAKHSWYNEYEELFVNAMTGVMEDYESVLQNENVTDFTRLLQNAAVAVRDIDTISFNKKMCDIRSLRFVFVDEFQDFSQLFMQLILGLRHRNRQIRLYCVGDDWQSINGFTGAKLHFFHRAQEFFPGMRRIELLTNFRSASSIVEFGNDVMAGFGSLARAREAAGVGSVRIYCLDAFIPQHIEHVRHRADPQVPMLLRLIQEALSKTRQKITVLCRTNMLADPINAGRESEHTYKLLDLQDELHRYLPKWAHAYVQVSTIHTYKGMESDCVIIIDAQEKRYPHIHPDWILTRIFGNSIEEVIEEERRLFYVAVTRAKSHLVVLTQSGAVTPFLSDDQIQGVPTYIRSAKELDLLQPLKRQSEKMTVHVGTKPTQFGAIAAIKDALIKAGYFYSNPAQAWCKTFRPQELKNIITEDWISLASDIYIEIFDEYNQLYVLAYVEDGNWITLHKNEESLKPLLSDHDYESAP